jgi:hypothetical protein
MLSIQQTNILGQILETSWGKSSDIYKCKANIVGNDTLRVMYSTVVYLASERGMESQIPPVAEEANAIISNLISDCKKQYKDISGEALSLKEISQRDNVELVQASQVNPRRVVLYRKFADFSIG